MSKSLTVWIDPLDAPPSLQAAIDITKAQAASISTPTRTYAPSLLLPTHYGQWAQAQCRQNLPPDLLVSTPDDITTIRQAVEAQGVGFGVWGVPVELNSVAIAASHAAAGGYYVANFEPTAAFWAPGDDPQAIDDWWSGFWNSLPDQSAINGDVAVTVVPNSWGIGAFDRSMRNLVGGASLVLMESYGGPNTADSYPYPNCWPAESASEVQGALWNAENPPPLACILSNLNLEAQAGQAARIGSGNVHSWYCR